MVTLAYERLDDVVDRSNSDYVLDELTDEERAIRKRAHEMTQRFGSPSRVGLRIRMVFFEHAAEQVTGGHD